MNLFNEHINITEHKFECKKKCLLKTMENGL